MVQSSIAGNAVILRTDANGTMINYPAVASGSVNLFAESKDLDFGHHDKQKYVDRFVFALKAPAGVDVPALSVNIGYRDSLEDSVTWLGARIIELDNPHYQLRTTARFFKIKITDDFPVAQWKLTQIEVYGRIVGGRL